ncbi:hypothetical protein DU508_21690 [Pedobacter chinensis]|uniref:Uncharacterized protein n=2 Tax=Pedobacter chinensis TaxID=2282421 RepID=A0A369PTP5_9SPHI|nr:hypothetical protein DU508_21690 [Pedobacter chinensis]
MITLILGSALLAFTVLRKPKPEGFPRMPAQSLPSSGGLGQALSIYQDLEQLEVLNGQVREILKKQKLSDADSTLLKGKLKQIDSIYKRAGAH